MTPLLETRDVSLAFDGLLAVNRLSLEIFPGDVAALVGPNGAGKTSWFNVVNGLLRPSHGSVFFRGADITGWPGDRVARLGIARTFQDLRFARGLSAVDNVVLARPAQKGETFIGALLRRQAWARQEESAHAAARSLLQTVGLQEMETGMAQELSYGQQKLLTLACCLSTGAGLLLLDEPFSGIHPELISRLIQLLGTLASEGKTILFIEHNIEAVKKVAHRVIVLDRGCKVADGGPDVLDRPEILDIYLR
jgi:ABC-type branched-subunit amino acid transport system ATPase component